MIFTDVTTKPGLAVGERGGTVTLEPARPDSQPLSPYTNGPIATPSAEPGYHRFHGSVAINPRLMAGDAGKIMDEVVKHLTTLYGPMCR